MRFLFYATYSKLQANQHDKKIPCATRSAGAFPATAVTNVISGIILSQLKRGLSIKLRPFAIPRGYGLPVQFGFLSRLCSICRRHRSVGLRWMRSFLAHALLLPHEFEDGS
jgi:hypothetical protein